MDLSTLLCGYRRLRSEDAAQKLKALRHAFDRLPEADRPVDLAAFVERLPRTLVSRRFGTDTDDFYVTSTYASIAAYEPVPDPLLAATVNRIVLQLNFQTRFVNTRGMPEALVLDGAPQLLPLMMVNGNVVMGMAGSPVARMSPVPTWSERLPQLNLKSELLFERTLPDVEPTLRSLARDRVGCLVVALAPSEEPVPLQARYEALGPMMRLDTFTVLAGAASSIVAVMGEVQRRAPEARIVGRAYAGLDGAPRALCVVSGVDGVPPATLPALQPQRRAFVAGYRPADFERDGVRALPYFAGEDGAEHEVIRLSPPLLIHAAAPLSEEARRHMTEAQTFPHRALEVRNGGVFSSIDPYHVTYVHVDGEGRVLDDVGEDGNLPNTPTWRTGGLDEAGQRFGFTRLLDRLHVPGTAMPLTFTPTLHDFFSHFLLQCFPRVLIAESLGIEVSFLVPPTLKRKQREMLNLIGVPPERIVPIPPDILVTADSLIIPQPWPLAFSPHTLTIYDRLTAKVGLSRAPVVERRVLISREAHTHWRNMLTYEAVRALLQERFDFTVVRPELLSLAEEIELFHTSSIIAGAEGAGLYSACYSQPGQTFCSISDEDYVMAILASATSGKGSQVAYCFGESYRADTDVARRVLAGHSDYAMSPAMVERFMHAVLDLTRPHRG